MLDDASIKLPLLQFGMTPTWQTQPQAATQHRQRNDKPHINVARPALRLQLEGNGVGEDRAWGRRGDLQPPHLEVSLPAEPLHLSECRPKPVNLLLCIQWLDRKLQMPPAALEMSLLCVHVCAVWCIAAVCCVVCVCSPLQPRHAAPRPRGCTHALPSPSLAARHAPKGSGNYSERLKEMQ